MASGDWLPKNDLELAQWVTNFCTALIPRVVEVGITQQDVTPIDGANLTFGATIADASTKQTAAVNATAAKGAARGDVVTPLRTLVRRINNHPGMTNELRTALGLPVRDDVRTNERQVGEEVPGIYLETLPGTVIVHFGTAPQNEQMNGKPDWAKGVNIYRMKNGEDAFLLLGFVTASPYVDTIEGAPAAYCYYVQYRGTRVTDVGQSSTPATVAASGLLAA